MAQKFEIITPENITVDYDVAGIGTRGLAVIVDEILLYGTLVVMGFLLLMFSGFLSMSGLDRLSENLSRTTMALSIVILFFVYTGYYTFFEIALKGQTPGKRLVGIEVIYEDGRTLSWQGAFMRNLLRPADYIGFYFVGIFVAFCNLHSKRIGDYAAGTIVIRRRRQTAMTMVSPSVMAPAHLNLSQQAVVARMPFAEIQPIIQLLERRDQLPVDVRRNLTNQMSDQFIQKLQLEEITDQLGLLKEITEVWKNNQN